MITTTPPPKKTHLGNRTPLAPRSDWTKPHVWCRRKASVCCMTGIDDNLSKIAPPPWAVLTISWIKSNSNELRRVWKRKLTPPLWQDATVPFFTNIVTRLLPAHSSAERDMDTESKKWSLRIEREPKKVTKRCFLLKIKKIIKHPRVRLDLEIIRLLTSPQASGKLEIKCQN